MASASLLSLKSFSSRFPGGMPYAIARIASSSFSQRSESGT